MIFIKGRISKFESFGGVDGPGLRFVVFFQGCNLRCAYCHNPETWEINGGSEFSSQEVLKRILQYKNYFGDRGGVTFSGGEPILQAKFLAECAVLCKENNINTALDTSGSLLNEDVLYALNYIDLVILDIKMTNEKDYIDYTKGDINQTLKFLDALQKTNKDVWVRQVIIPTVNDNEENIKRLKEICERYSCVKKIELLPFKKLCLSKYDELGLDFKFRDMPDCEGGTLEGLREML